MFKYCLATTGFLFLTVALSIFIHECFANKPDAYSVKMDRDVYTGHSLISHVIETHRVHSPLACNVKCFSNCLCVSFNVCENGKKCELNSERKDDYAVNYKVNEKCIYYELSWSAQSTGNNKKVPTCGGCCLTSKPCLHGGTCRAVDHINGQRYQCSCPDGFKGKRCEIKPRSCADYFQSTVRTNGIRVIFTPENTTLKVFCHFRETSTMTLALSFSRDNDPRVRGKSATTDYPLNEDLPQWPIYRLSLTHMQGLRDVSTHWAMTCAYDTRGFSTTDYLLSKISDTDITTWQVVLGAECRLFEYLNIKNNFCENCRIKAYQKGGLFHIGSNSLSQCDGLTLSGGVVTCETGGTYYFAKYLCNDLDFSCMKSSTSTTQLWFIN